jgi:predicted TIM-barrel enzyme
MTHPGRAKLSSSARAKKPLIIAGVGCGLTARGASEGGADLLAVYNTAIYRIRNLPSILAFLPGDDPNALTRATAAEVVANAGDRPVLLGFAVHNPQLSFDRLLDQTVVLGGAGITNEPFVGLYGSAFGRQLERAGCGFSGEVAFIEAAARRGMMTLGWACDPEEARRMSGAGADLIGLMLGITSADNDADLHDAIERTHAMARIWPSTKPVSLRPRRNAASKSDALSAEFKMFMKPTTGIAGCCARPTSGHAAAVTPIRAMKSRRLTGLLPVEDGTLPHGMTTLLRITVNFLTNDRNGSESASPAKGRRGRTSFDSGRAVTRTGRPGRATNGPMRCSKRLHHSITSSASDRNDSGMLRPSAFAVARLTTTSNFVGYCTGRSLGLAPLSNLLTYSAPCWN